MWKRSKKIEGVSSSSIIGLKAESTNVATSDRRYDGPVEGELRLKPKTTPTAAAPNLPSNAGVEARNKKDVTEEDVAKQRQAEALQSKVVLYDAMCMYGDDDMLHYAAKKYIAPGDDDECLVDFARKQDLTGIVPEFMDDDDQLVHKSRSKGVEIPPPHSEKGAAIPPPSFLEAGEYISIEKQTPPPPVPPQEERNYRTGMTKDEAVAFHGTGIAITRYNMMDIPTEVLFDPKRREEKARIAKLLETETREGREKQAALRQQRENATAKRLQYMQEKMNAGKPK